MSKEVVSDIVAQLAQERAKKSASDETANDLATRLVQSVRAGATTGDRLLDMQIAETGHTDPQDFYALYQRLDQRVKECVSQFVLVLVWQEHERERYGHHDQDQVFPSKDKLTQMRLGVIGGGGLVLERAEKCRCNITTAVQAIWEHKDGSIPGIRVESGPLRPITIRHLAPIPLALIKQANETLELSVPTRSLMNFASKNVDLLVGYDAIAHWFDTSYPRRIGFHEHSALLNYRELGVHLARIPPVFPKLASSLIKYQTQLQEKHSEAKLKLTALRHKFLKDEEELMNEIDSTVEKALSCKLNLK